MHLTIGSILDKIHQLYGIVDLLEVFLLGKLYKAYLLSYHPEIMEDRQFMDCIADLFNTPEIQGLEKFEQHLLINRQ